MVRAPRARNIFPALLSIFRPLSPDILPPMWEGKLFSYILSSPSRVGKHGDDRASPPPQVRCLAFCTLRFASFSHYCLVTTFLKTDPSPGLFQLCSRSGGFEV